MIEHWLSIIEMYLSGHTATKALVAGFVTSWCVTQGGKYHPAIARMSDAAARLATRAVAFVTAFGPVAYLWPNPGSERWVIAVMVGVASPAAYTILVRVVGHFWPWLVQYVSARPAQQ